MGRDLIISQNALHSQLNAVVEKASHQLWQESQNNSEIREVPTVNRQRLNSIMEAAANNPIGLAIMARRILYNESYQTAVSRVAGVTRIPQTETASRMRVYRLKSLFNSSI